MKRERAGGFTLIELLITITIMVILLALTVVSLRSTQANARDEERKTDVESIARHLEVFYDSGVLGSTSTSYAPTLASSSTYHHLAVFSPSSNKARYPSTEAMDTEDEIKFTLRDIDSKTIRSPGIAETSSPSLIVANNAGAQTPTINQYIYQPLTRSNTRCTSESDDCHRYILYYRLETNASVQKIESRRQ